MCFLHCSPGISIQSSRQIPTCAIFSGLDKYFVRSVSREFPRINPYATQDIALGKWKMSFFSNAYCSLRAIGRALKLTPLERGKKVLSNAYLNDINVRVERQHFTGNVKNQNF
jgi:hypothetical protein